MGDSPKILNSKEDFSSSRCRNERRTALSKLFLVGFQIKKWNVPYIEYLISLVSIFSRIILVIECEKVTIGGAAGRLDGWKEESKNAGIIA